jgi:hypothetical protein
MTRPRVFDHKLEAYTTREQSEAVDRFCGNQLADRATKIRLLIDLGLQQVGIVTARPTMANGSHHPIEHA